MRAAEFLYELRKHLRKLPPLERDQAMAYYEEYFVEAGHEGEAALIERLGTPAQVASGIIGEFALRDMNGQSSTGAKGGGLKTMWIVILAIFGVPIAIPLIIALLAVVFSLAVSLLCVLISFFAVAAAMVLAGIAVALVGLVALFLNPVEALAILGVALVVLSLGMAAFLGTVKLSQLSIRLVTWIFAKVLRRKGGN